MHRTEIRRPGSPLLEDGFGLLESFLGALVAPLDRLSGLASFVLSVLDLQSVRIVQSSSGFGI